ncbi:4427_t:CDS:2, partial [Scutellospora calospora]
MNSKSSDKLKCVCETATWCRVCNSVHFKKQFDEWTSGNETIDNFIQKIQLEAINDAKILEWVPFKYISSVEPLAKGGYGIVYKAKWELGPISHYDNEIKSWCRSGKTDVVLKYIKNLNNFYEFFQEITAQMTSTKEFGYIIRCYGITKCPGADKYLMITDYKKDGNLEKYLYSNFKRLNWERKLELLYTTIK